MKPSHKKLKYVDSEKRVHYIQMYEPDLSQMRHEPLEVLRAVQYWRLSQSPIMPRYEDMRWRDDDWDNDVYMMRLAIEFREDDAKRKMFGL